MKHKTNIVLGACLLIALSCTDTDVAPSPPALNSEPQSLSAGLPVGPKGTVTTNGRTATLQPLNIISASTLASAISTNLIGLKKYKDNPNAYLQYKSGRPYVNLGRVIGNPVFNYPLRWNALMSPTVPAVFPYDAVKAEFSTQLNQLNVSSQFKSRLLNFFDVIRNIDSYSYQTFSASINAQLFAIANQQRGGSQPVMTPLEQFALSQAFYHMKYLAESARNNASSSCLPQTREEWKEVAEAAFIAGMGGGLKLGWTWAVAGAIAAAPNPVVGGIVGGSIGFVTGFIGGALMGGGIKLMADCLVNKLYNPMQGYTCPGTIGQFGDFRASGLPPVGCIIAYANNMPEFPQIPIVPNQGALTINGAVISDINWLMSYL